MKPMNVWKIIAVVAVLFGVGVCVGAWGQHIYQEQHNRVCYKENLAGLLWVDCAAFKYGANTTIITQETANYCAKHIERFMEDYENVSLTIKVTT
jgi:hypothetical protein